VQAKIFTAVAVCIQNQCGSAMHPITCSFTTRRLDTAQLNALSPLVSGFFFVFFLGGTELAWSPTIP
jgi:hypothetical protein